MKRTLEDTDLPDNIQIKIVNFLKSEIYTLNYDLNSINCWTNLANILSVESDDARGRPYTWIQLKKYFLNTLMYHLSHPKYHLTYDEKIRIIYPFLLSYYQICVRFYREVETLPKLPVPVIEKNRALIQHTVSKKFNKNLYKIISQINNTSETIRLNINLYHIDKYQFDEQTKQKIESIIVEPGSDFENHEQQQLHQQTPVKQSRLQESIEIENSNSNSSIEIQSFIRSSSIVSIKDGTSLTLPSPLQQETKNYVKKSRKRQSGSENCNLIPYSSIETQSHISALPIAKTRHRTIVSPTSNHSLTVTSPLQPKIKDCVKTAHKKNSRIKISSIETQIFIRSSPITTARHRTIDSPSSNHSITSSSLQQKTTDSVKKSQQKNCVIQNSNLNSLIETQASPSRPSPITTARHRTIDSPSSNHSITSSPLQQKTKNSVKTARQKNIEFENSNLNSSIETQSYISSSPIATTKHKIIVSPSSNRSSSSTGVPSSLPLSLPAPTRLPTAKIPMLRLVSDNLSVLDHLKEFNSELNIKRSSAECVSKIINSMFRDRLS